MDRRSFIGESALTGASLTAALPFIFGLSNANAEGKAQTDYIDYPGYNGALKYKILWTNKAELGGTASCTMLLAEPGVKIPQHIHPQGEYVYIVDGSLRIDSTFANGSKETMRYMKGDSIFVPTNTIHTTELSEGVEVLVFEPMPSKRI